MMGNKNAMGGRKKEKIAIKKDKNADIDLIIKIIKNIK